jgi:hypothetical protein
MKNNTYDQFGNNSLVPTQGIGINIKGGGNDIVIPQGKGQYDLYAYGYTNMKKVSLDAGYTWVNVNDGIDAVIGGQGQDFFVSQSLSYQESFNIFKNKFVKVENVGGKGAKFFVGGSYDDLLAGSSGADLLVGDRFNGYELYLNTNALASNIPAQFVDFKNRLLSYQPDDWQKPMRQMAPDNSSRAYFGLGDKLNKEFGDTNDLTNQYWVPGNDVIHGYDGDDLIYGDNNQEDNLKILKLLKDESWMGRSRLGDDFIDAGSGNDIVFAGFGSDAIIGGLGSDVIHCGDLIIAPGYTPLYGPKIIWGGEYNKFGGDSETDTFIIGDIYDEESRILASNKGLENYATKLQNIKDKNDILAKFWNGVEFVASINDVTDAIAKLIGEYASYLGSTPPVPQPEITDPNDLDTVTFIKDFGKSDIVIFKTSSGSQLTAELKSGAFDGAGYSARNPLIKGDLPYSGMALGYGNSQLKQYATRVILDGYTGPLYTLGTFQSSNNDGTYRVVGGSAFANYAQGPYPPVNSRLEMSSVNRLISSDYFSSDSTPFLPIM